MFRALILDWSGTLVDDMGPTLAATNAVLARFDKPALTAEEFRQSFRLPYSEWYDEQLPGVPLEELEGHFREAFEASEHPVTPLEGTAEFLRGGEGNGIRLFVLTSMDARNFEEQLHRFGFAGHFEGTYAGVIDKRKVIREILHTHGLRAEETAYVGDMAHDIETAHHGGVTSVGVLSGYDPQARLAAAGPKLLLSCIKSLHAMLESWQVRARDGALTGRGGWIEIRRLQVEAMIGVPAEERGTPQRLFVSVRIVPRIGFGEMEDEISRTVDYDAVAKRVQALAGEKPRHLIETLADDVARMVLGEFSACEVEVEVEKHILPDTEAVVVRTRQVRC
jgi:phosphoglycolate phosphatase